MEAVQQRRSSRPPLTGHRRWVAPPTVVAGTGALPPDHLAALAAAAVAVRDLITPCLTPKTDSVSCGWPLMRLARQYMPSMWLLYPTSRSQPNLWADEAYLLQPPSPCYHLYQHRCLVDSRLWWRRPRLPG
jgi:hypothetical protein